MFSAAGSIVPEPSIMLPPMPFIDVVTTGCEEAEYMASEAFAETGTVAAATAVRQSLHRLACYAKAPGAGCWRKLEERSNPGELLEGSVTEDGQRRELLHAGSSGRESFGRASVN